MFRSRRGAMRGRLLRPDSVPAKTLSQDLPRILEGAIVVLGRYRPMS